MPTNSSGETIGLDQRAAHDRTLLEHLPPDTKRLAQSPGLLAPLHQGMSVARELHDARTSAATASGRAPRRPPAAAKPGPCARCGCRGPPSARRLGKGTSCRSSTLNNPDHSATPVDCHMRQTEALWTQPLPARTAGNDPVHDRPSTPSHAGSHHRLRTHHSRATRRAARGQRQLQAEFLRTSCRNDPVT